MPPTLFSTCLFTLVLHQKEINYCGGSFAPFLLRFHDDHSHTLAKRNFFSLIFSWPHLPKLLPRMNLTSSPPLMLESIQVSSQIFMPSFFCTPKASVQWSSICRGCKNSYVSSREYFWYFICHIHINIHRNIWLFAYIESIYTYGFPDVLTCNLYILGQSVVFPLIIYERKTKMASVLLRELSKVKLGANEEVWHAQVFTRTWPHLLLISNENSFHLPLFEDNFSALQPVVFINCLSEWDW